MTASRNASALPLTVFLCAALVLGCILTGCATGPKPPQPGTPAFYWAAAREMYRAGDYAKTNDNLGQITKSENEFTARARVWELVMASGLAQGNTELAETYDLGARANRNNPAPFRRQASLLRGQAAAAALQFAEAFHAYQHSTTEPEVKLEFDFPGGSAAQPPELKRIGAGILVPDAELALIQRAMIRRGVLLATCRAVGAPDDAAKALEIFKPGSPSVPADAFRLNMARMLHEHALLFGPNKLDQPNRVKMLCGEAMEAVQKLPASRQTKELYGKIQSTMKKSKIT